MKQQDRTRLHRTSSRTHCTTPILATVVFVLTTVSWGSALGDDAARTKEEGVAFFETNIRPLLVTHCYSCHAADSKKIKGGLTLDTKAGWEKGGDLGPSIVPGDPKNSLLMEAVRYEDEGLLMPPKGKLPDADVARLAQWISMGAPDPRTGAPAPAASEGTGMSSPEAIAEARKTWTYRPRVDPPAPEVVDHAWAASSLDRFILARLEAKGLRPAPPADKRTLIRRATFDMTGLPPSRQEIDAFLADETPDAFARVVDRLLASPRYGERWGRHWLDVARYADSNGLDENLAFGNAWRYRDYVIAAFNDDKPYDQFVREQIAGDQSTDAETEAAARHESLIATGFLSIGPKVLAEPDPEKMRMDIVDEQVDAVGRVFMGLTMGCARCHDHKFDPISTADYYALAGIFKSTKTMDSFKIVAKWHENSIADADDLARKAAHEARVAAKKKEIDEAVAGETARIKKEKGEAFAIPKDAEAKLYAPAVRDRLKKLREEAAAIDKEAPEEPTAMGVVDDAVADAPIHVRGSHMTLGKIVHRRVPTVFHESTSNPDFDAAASGRLALARWLSAPEHPLTARVMVNRLWRWHFGKGLVPTPDNFGRNGEPPTHPDLLDWLASRFVEDGWSIKAMHRRILLSSTYRMSSDHDARGGEVDPENRLYWRVDVRRLEAEEVRDALLAVAGVLDSKMGGSMLAVKNRDYFFNHTSKDTVTYDAPRRSVYLPVVRNNLYDVFQLFDYSDAEVLNGDRQSSVVAPQALFMMNAPLVIDLSNRLATALLGDPGLDDDGRLARLYQTALGRPATADEIARAGEFLHRFAAISPLPADDAAGRRREAWRAVCQAIVSSNEFFYIR